MTTPELEKYLSTNIGKPKIEALSHKLAADGDDLKELIDITFHTDGAVAFRAAWVAETIFLDEYAVFLPYLPYLISRFKEVKNPGCQRHYAKIAMHMTDPKAPNEVKKAIDKLNLEPTIERCFEWMIDPNVKVAVKVFASEALFHLRHRYLWIPEELSDQLQFLMRDGTAAIQACGKRLLKQLNAINRKRP